MMRLYSRQQILNKIPQLKEISFSYWSLKAGIRPYKKRTIKNRITFFYTPNAILKLESVLRKHKPELFKSNQEVRP